jgi:hypothetical protein
VLGLVDNDLSRVNVDPVWLGKQAMQERATSV